MVYKISFSSIIVYLLLGLSSLFIAGILLVRSEYIYSFFLIGFGIFSSIRLIWIFNQTNRSIAYFFDALRNNDTSVSFPVKISNRSLEILHDSMNKLNLSIQKMQLQNEYKERYYKSLIDHSTAALVVISNNLEIELINQTACIYAGISPDSTNLKLIKIRNKEFYDILCQVKPGQSISFNSVNKDGTSKNLIFRATEISDGKNSVKLVSIQDIRQELDEKELESYQKLISILTHEIMNSVAPFTSISKTLNGFYIKNNLPVHPGEIDETIVNTTVQGLKVIEEQSKGLLKFVNNYRVLTKIPQLVRKPFDIREWMDQIKILFSEKFTNSGISLEIEVDERIREITADKNLLNQVLVNMLNNAIDALLQINTERKIKISIFKNKGNRIIINIINNGPYISDELKQKIFIPFFTTKENGSGIGLSLSRQIIRLHNGSINVNSNQGEETVFTIEL